MGDVIHALPLAADIARALPQATLDWVVEEGFAAIPAMSRHVSTVHQVALRRWRHAPLASGHRSEIARLKRGLRAARYDLVLDAQGLLKSAWVARWANAPVAGFSSASARERAGVALLSDRGFDIPRTLHAIDRCRALGAQALGYEVEGPASLRPAVRIATGRHRARSLRRAADQRQPRDQALAGRPLDRGRAGPGGARTAERALLGLGGRGRAHPRTGRADAARARRAAFVARFDRRDPRRRAASSSVSTRGCRTSRRRLAARRWPSTATTTPAWSGSSATARSPASAAPACRRPRRR